MKVLFLLLAGYLIAINVQVLKADDDSPSTEATAEDNTSKAAEEGAPESSAPAGEATTVEDKPSQAAEEGTSEDIMTPAAESTEATTPEDMPFKPPEDETSDSKAPDGESTEGVPTESEAASTEATTEEPTTTPTTTVKPVKTIKLDGTQLKQMYNNLSKYFDTSTKETQNIIMNISTVFGKQLTTFTTCLGGDWVRKCRWEILKCTYNSAPPMCLWKLGCSGKTCDKNVITTTSATTLSPGRALLRNAMEAAGLKCDKFRDCLKNLGFSFANFIPSLNWSKFNSTLKPGDGEVNHDVQKALSIGKSATTTAVPATTAKTTKGKAKTTKKA